MTAGLCHADEVARQELAAVTYQYNVMGTRGPRRMVAMIPALDVDSRPLTFRASARNEKAILTRYHPFKTQLSCRAPE